MKYLLLCLMMVFVIKLNAQNAYTSGQAMEIFKSGDYEQAGEAYAYLLSKYDREPKYNYYYGICLLQINKDIPEAVKRLKYAVLKGVSRDAYYYLGRAYQLSYDFEAALGQYDRFLRFASASDIRNDNAELYKAQCEVGKEYSTKVYDLNVGSRDTVLKKDFLSRYHPVKDVGAIMRNADFFESGVDPEGVLYLTERGDEVYFAMLNEQGKRDLYKMEKLLDGWSDSKPLTEINSGDDDMYPFLMIDGETLYFSSNRDGGMGGFDIYRCVYDSETKSFTRPVNMGIPFNSPKDDFLFVADDFTKTAWFASNRETGDSTVIVYGLRWDANVVKSLVTDISEVANKAALHLSAEQSKPMVQRPLTEKAGSSPSESGFRFVVGDTLIYTRLSHFSSGEARAYFEEAQRLTLQKDSLSQLMHGKRNSYARASVEAERTRLVNEILSLEKQVYGLDSKIETALNNARVTEVERIKELVRQGRYVSPVNIESKPKVKKGVQLETLEIPSGYTYYTNDEFARQMEELKPMYERLFDAEEVLQLKSADSLYVWGHILSLESAKLLEETNNQSWSREPVVMMPFKRKDSTASGSVAGESVVEQSKKLKETSLKAYHASLDIKHRIYNDKMISLVKASSTSDLAFVEEPLGAANTYFRKADELMNPMMGYDIADIEKAGALKRSGVQAQEGALFSYLDGVKGREKKTKTVSRTPRTYQEWQGNTGAKSAGKSSAPASTAKIVQSEYEYRIQIGVFRNEPDARALGSLPAVSKTEIPERGLTKYFAGSFISYAEAAKDLSKVRSAGFSGAFVVVFKEGRQINLTDDLKK